MIDALDFRQTMRVEFGEWKDRREKSMNEKTVFIDELGF